MKTADISVELLDYMGSDLSVVNAARVSFDKESDWEWIEVDGSDEPMLPVADKKLINYLARHNHTSPFNHSFASFRVKAPIFVARQLVKHKFLPWNEVSRRYVDSEPEFYFPEYWRKRADNVKQGSSEVPADIDDDEVKRQIRNGLWKYQEMLEAGVCPEQARMILPQNTMTEWIWSGTLGAWGDMLNLRLDPHAQRETREVAGLIRKELEAIFPVSLYALLEAP